jgi:hypothetical protein
LHTENPELRRVSRRAAHADLGSARASRAGFGVLAEMNFDFDLGLQTPIFAQLRRGRPQLMRKN